MFRKKCIQVVLLLASCVRQKTLSRRRACRRRNLHSASNHGVNGQRRDLTVQTGRKASSNSDVTVEYESKSCVTVNAGVTSMLLKSGWSRRASAKASRSRLFQ